MNLTPTAVRASTSSAGVSSNKFSKLQPQLFIALVLLPQKLGHVTGLTRASGDNSLHSGEVVQPHVQDSGRAVLCQ